MHSRKGKKECFSSVNSLLDGGSQRGWVGAHDLSDLLAALEDDEGGHSADAELLRDVGDLIDVHLDEVCGGELLGELDDLRRDHLAGAAPRGEAVKDDDLILEGGGEFLFAGNVVDTHFGSAGGERSG